MFEVSRLKQLIEVGIENCTAHVESDDGEHFSATVVAPVFGTLNRVKQHQLVYKAIGAYVGREIHALGVGRRKSDRPVHPPQEGPPSYTFQFLV